MGIEGFQLDGKNALVTGSNRGLGEAIAIALARAGANVGCHGRHSKPCLYAMEFWNELIAVNLTSFFHLSQLAGQQMLKKSGGKIVNIASLLSFQGGILVSAYAAAKGGVAQLTKALANEWAAKGINVNAIAPGYIATDNTTALRNDPARSKQILERIPAGRWGEPTDIAGAAVFLCSQASNYVHGHVLAVDGGWLAR